MRVATLILWRLSLLVYLVGLIVPAPDWSYVPSGVLLVVYTPVALVFMGLTGVILAAAHPLYFLAVLLVAAERRKAVVPAALGFLISLAFLQLPLLCVWCWSASLGLMLLASLLALAPAALELRPLASARRDDE